MPQSRRLTAIMFADIAGYTSMMQRNEKKGLAIVHRFSEVMEAEAASNNGEILEFRGDGCLAVFNSAVEAMHAAKSIQESLKEEPKVPLRIGIHIGDIVFTDGNIYGDGVNLASRVESLGVPGSILVTERVIHDVKSHPEFEMASLGKFQFKNVEKPMEVFALANEGFVVPKKQEMKGKLAKTGMKKQQKKGLAGALLTVLLFIAGSSYFWEDFAEKSSIERRGISEKPVIAVLPFRDLSPERDQEYFCDGTAEEILNALAGLKGLSVLGRGSSFSFKGQSISLKEIGSKLSATVLLDGSIRRTKDKIRINVQLINAANESTLWTDQYDKRPGDIFAIQEDIARKVIDRLQITLLPGENQALLATQTTNILAHEWYLKGLESANQGARNADETIKYYKQAIEIDSLYYSAWVELGKAYFSKGIYGGGKAFYDLVPTHLEKAIQLNPNLPKAYFEYARYLIWYNADKEAASSMYQAAVERGIVEPNEIQAHLSLIAGNPQKALSLVEQMMENDPFSLEKKIEFSRLSLVTGNFDKVLAISNEALEDNPKLSSILRHRGEALIHLGRYKEAEAIFEDLISLKGYAAYGLAAAKYYLGKKKEAQKILDTYKPELISLDIANIYMAFGETDSALVYLDKAIREKDLGFLLIKNSGFIQPYLGDLRFQKLLEQL